MPSATLYSLYGIIMSITFIAAGLFGSGKMVNALTGGELTTIAEKLDYRVPVYSFVQTNEETGEGSYQWSS